MKYYIILCTAITISISYVFAQNEYLIKDTKTTVLSLGSKSDKKDFYTDKTEMKVLNNNVLEYIETKNLTPINLLNSEELLNRIKVKDLMFVFEGWKPFWVAEINANTICLTLPDDSTIEANIEFTYNKVNHTFHVGFKSDNSNIFGTISKVNCDCEIEVNDRLEYAEYRINLVVDDVIYYNCGSLEKNRL